MRADLFIIPMILIPLFAMIINHLVVWHLAFRDQVALETAASVLRRATASSLFGNQGPLPSTDFELEEIEFHARHPQSPPSTSA
jgi:hypothetical protein